MVTESILSLIYSIVSLSIFNLPAPDVPEFFAQASDGISQLAIVMNKFDPWIPVGLLTAILSAWIISWTLAITIKLTRIVISNFTGGGGAA